MFELDNARSILVRTPSGGVDLDLMVSMTTTASVIAHLARKLREYDIDAVVTWEGTDDVVVGFGLAQDLGTERACVRDDMGKLLIAGPDLTDKRVAAVALTWSDQNGRDVLKTALNTAGAIVVAQAEAISQATLTALAEEPA